MIRTGEEMHHSPAMSHSAQYTWPLWQDVAVGCKHQERRMDQDLSGYKCLPPLKENCKARDRMLWEQQAPAHQE